ncbi:MAG TPA: LON peptidase substrate-binding domain-containing protein [Alphaproteobacteria bacterium]
MAQHQTPSLTALPARLPLFPLRGALLLPGGELPLNIFEPRYLAMTQMAMRSDRLIGMIQPKNEKGALYQIGCAGRITTFSETDDGRYLITLRGLCRFKLKQAELTSDHFYLGDVEWIDTIPVEKDIPTYAPTSCRTKFKKLLDTYLARENMKIDWGEALNLPEAKFYTIIAMLAPLSPSEKQALLEADDISARCDMLYNLLEMAVAETESGDDKNRPVH